MRKPQLFVLLWLGVWRLGGVKSKSKRQKGMKGGTGSIKIGLKAPEKVIWRWIEKAGDPAIKVNAE